MAALPLSPSEISIAKKVPSMNSSRFTRIPSWISLNPSSSSSPPSITTNQNKSGTIENLHLVSLSKQGKLNEALEFLNRMEESGTTVQTHSYKSLLESCEEMGSLSKLRMIHQRIQATMKDPPAFLFNFILRVYCQLGCLVDAQRLFDDMLTKDSLSWGTMISAYVQNGFFLEAFRVFTGLLVGGSNSYSSVYVSLIGALLSPSCLKLGKQIHSLVIRKGLTPNISVDTSLSNMYFKCGCMESAKLIFDRMTEKNVVSWTGLMVGYNQVGKSDEALLLFQRMLEEGVHLDEFVMSVVLKACSILKDLDTGRKIHGCAIKCGMDVDVSVGTPIVDFYVKCGTLDDAQWAFDRISHPNDVSWSSIITGYSQNRKFEECLGAFKNVRHRASVLNSSIYTSLFQACSMLADLNLGMQVHADAVKRGLVSDLYGESALITMYSRSGRISYARQAFDLIEEPDTVAWTAIIAGCAYHGQASEALELFERMQSCGVRPNSVTFIGLFTACSHSGLVVEARQYLDSMSSQFGVEPTIDHYDCMIDIYARAGRLEEALFFIRSMPFEADVMSWKSLLGGCWMYRNVKLGEIAAKNLLQLDPEDTAGHILLFNLYASCGKLNEAAHVRKTMATRDLTKDVSCSWLTIKGKVHRFVVGDRHHPQTEEIYSKLKELDFPIFKDDVNHSSDVNALCNLHEVRKEQLLDHSERLAIAYGLISTSSTAPIMVFKNLRACTDCHDFAKHVSKVTGRKLVVRDSSRFHHFVFGECSCNDYW